MNFDANPSALIISNEIRPTIDEMPLFRLKTLPKCQEKFVRNLLNERFFLILEDKNQEETILDYRRTDLRLWDQIRQIIILNHKRPEFNTNDCTQNEDFELEKYYFTSTIQVGESLIESTIFASVIEPKGFSGTRGSCKFDINFNDNAFNFETLSFEDIIILKRALEKTFIKSNAVNLDSLSIISDHAAWQINIDLKILKKCGNLLNSCSIASLISLLIFEIPQVEIFDRKKGIFSILHPNISIPEPIILNHKPLSISFSLFKHHTLNYLYLCDPNNIEEKLADGNLAISINNMNDICSFNISGSIKFDSLNIIRNAIELANEQYQKTLKIILEQIQIVKNSQTEEKYISSNACKNEPFDSNIKNNEQLKIARILSKELAISPYDKIRKLAKLEGKDEKVSYDTSEQNTYYENGSSSYSSYSYSS